MVGIILSTIVLAAAPSRAGTAQEIPILFNDHHVYATPDELKRGRVLAALVKGGTVLVPLRSMFEQMGATVTYNPSNKSVRVSKAGSDVQVTVGVPEVSINGEKRPLDVPPEIYKGTLVVPIRVISEGMGAYVQWVPDRQIVVVRYLPPTPPPTAPPAPPPTTAPTPPPTPSPTPKPYKNDLFVAGDYYVWGKTYDEFSPGNRFTTASYAVHGALQYQHFFVGGDFNSFRYPHYCAGLGDPACNVTVIGNGGQVFVPQFDVRNSFTEGHIGYELKWRIFVAGAWEFNNYNQGYPTLNGPGFGLEKLPDLDHPITIYASYYWYPRINGQYSGIGPTQTIYYSLQTYKGGVVWTFRKGFPVFIEAGYAGNRGISKVNAPGNGFINTGATVGIGFNLNP